jgi:hypothetical protein
MAHAQKPDFVFRRNGRVHLNGQGRQFSRLLAAEVCVSAVVMLDTPCSEVVWRVLATHSIRQFPLHFPSCASPCATTFQLDSITNYAYGIWRAERCRVKLKCLNICICISDRNMWVNGNKHLLAWLPLRNRYQGRVVLLSNQHQQVGSPHFVASCTAKWQHPTVTFGIWSNRVVVPTTEVGSNWLSDNALV